MDVRNQPLAMPAVQNLHIGKLLRDAHEVLRASEALFASLSREQLVWKSDRKTWSILECFDHLLVVNGLYLPRIEEALTHAGPGSLHDIVPFMPSRFGRLFVWAMRPEPPIKLRTFKAFRPKAGPENLEVTGAFIEQQKWFIEVLKQADAFNLNKIRLTSPISRLIRLSLGEALTALVAHEQRHLLQAQNIQLENQFPPFQI